MRYVLYCAAVAQIFMPAALSAGPRDAELELIRQQIDALRNEYESRIQELEQRLEQAENQARKAEAEAGLARQQARAAEVIAEEAATGGPVQAGTLQEKINAFNPAITAVLQGSMNSYSEDPDDYAVSGFQLGGESGLPAQGLTLDETELVLSANVDQLFYGQTTIALHDDENETEVEVEEAFVDALSLPGGVGLRFGRFYSDIGYLNRFHTHTWDFRDAPLGYRALLGKQYSDTGVQLSWVAPTDLYLRFGGETLRGNRFPGGDATRTIGNSQSVFAKIGGDIGASHSWQAGLSHLWVDARDRSSSHSHGHGGDDSARESFTGDSNLAIADFVWKWAPNGNPRYRNFKFQTEFFYREEDGRDTFTEGGDTALLDYDGTQKGLYAQAVYQFMPRWRIGTRYDWLSADNKLKVIDSGGLEPDEVLEETALNNDNHDPWRWSLMADWSPSEFSRIRLQYNRDRSRPETDHQWTLQYIMSLGSHGAHEF
jgi:hypothetical protein